MVLAAYNHLTMLLIRHGRQQRIKMVPINATNALKAERLYDWLATESITPMAYLASCFAKHSWRWRPKLDVLTDNTYRKYFADNSADAYLWAAAIRQDVEANTEVELPLGKEIVKRRFLYEGGAAFCMAQPHFSGGYNKLSKACQQCKLKQECSIRTDGETDGAADQVASRGFDPARQR